MRKEGQESTNSNCRSIRHLTCLWIGELQVFRRMQTALSPPEKQIPCSCKHFSHESPDERPSKGHDSAGYCDKNQCENQLFPPDPGPDCGAELNIAHPHAAHHCQYPVNQASEQHPPDALSQAMPPCDQGRYHQPAQQKRKYQPVWNPPAANVSNGRHNEHRQGRPPSIRVLQMLQTSSSSASRRDGFPIKQFCPHFRACQLSLDSMRYVGGIEASVHGSAGREYPCAITGIHRSNAYLRLCTRPISCLIPFFHSSTACPVNRKSLHPAKSNRSARFSGTRYGPSGRPEGTKLGPNDLRRLVGRLFAIYIRTQR